MSLDISDEIEGAFKVPKALAAFLAIIIGVLVLFFPYILNIMIAFFLIVWGLLKAIELGSKPSRSGTVQTSISAQLGGPEPESSSD